MKTKIICFKLSWNPAEDSWTTIVSDELRSPSRGDRSQASLVQKDQTVRTHSPISNHGEPFWIRGTSVQNLTYSLQKSVFFNRQPQSQHHGRYWVLWFSGNNDDEVQIYYLVPSAAFPLHWICSMMWVGCHSLQPWLNTWRQSSWAIDSYELSVPIIIHSYYLFSEAKDFASKGSS